jgi:hypothetical protein
MPSFERAYYSDGSEPAIIENRDDGHRRVVSATHARYLAWIAAGNTPAAASGDRFVTIVNGQPVIAADRQATLDAEAWAGIRRQRNARMTESDWTQIEDAPFNTTKKQAWRAYRQALRDLPQTQTDPFNIVWPTPPEVQ